MRKRVIDSALEAASPPEHNWLDLDSMATVEVTSEGEGHPIEAALLPHKDGGWSAASAGTQTIRLLFDKPQKLRRIRLVFEETKVQRTQEFVLRWAANGGDAYRDIVRQQWNFSPPDTVRETEDHSVELANVKALELVIVPDISGGEARASLLALRLAG
jgi:hypothetical protein